MTELSERDRQILAAEVADKVDQLRPMTSMPGWRKIFESEAARWSRRANGCPEASEARSEYNGWAIAHRLLLDEVQA